MRPCRWRPPLRNGRPIDSITGIASSSSYFAQTATKKFHFFDKVRLVRHGKIKFHAELISVSGLPFADALRLGRVRRSACSCPSQQRGRPEQLAPPVA
jgi:hypothetical protein